MVREGWLWVGSSPKPGAMSPRAVRRQTAQAVDRVDRLPIRDSFPMLRDQCPPALLSWGQYRPYGRRFLRRSFNLAVKSPLKVPNKTVFPTLRSSATASPAGARISFLAFLLSQIGSPHD